MKYFAKERILLPNVTYLQAWTRQVLFFSCDFQILLEEIWRTKYEQRIAPGEREAKEQSKRDMENSLLISTELKFLEVFLDIVSVFL